MWYIDFPTLLLVLAAGLDLGLAGIFGWKSSNEIFRVPHQYRLRDRRIECNLAVRRSTVSLMRGRLSWRPRHFCHRPNALAIGLPE